MQLSTDNKEFQEALKLVKYTRQSIFLTGKAGTGKSTFLKYVCQNVKKKHIVLAPTGVAATNAGGCTLHSFFKLPFYPLLPDDPNFSIRNGNLQKFLKYSSAHRKLIKEVELVIIDEISMVRPDIIDFIDKVLRVYSQNMREPFGGKQVMFVGDVFQLEPVIKSDEKEIISKFYRTPYFFSANVFSQIDLVSIELKQVYRQKDKVFINVLDHIRTNSAGSYDLQLLNTRYSRDIEDDGNDMYITLATRRDTVDYINDKKLSELPGDAVTFKGEIKGDFPESSLPTQVDLVLKESAQIIFIKNDYERRWVNGTIGTISGIDEDGGIYVITDEGSECKVMKDSWRNIRYTYNEEGYSRGGGVEEIVRLQGGCRVLSGRGTPRCGKCGGIGAATVRPCRNRFGCFAGTEVYGGARHGTRGGIADGVLIALGCGSVLDGHDVAHRPGVV